MRQTPGEPEWFMAEVVVSDWPRAVRWYADVLGLRLVLEDKAGEFALFRSGEGRIAIKRGDPVEGRGIRLIFRVENADAERERLLGLGVEVSTVKASEEGYREIRLADPDGTPIRLFSAPDEILP